MSTRRSALIGLTAIAAAALSACSGPYHVAADAKSFGQWPDGRAAGTYAFDRLPSQQGNKRQDELKPPPAARWKTGFKPAADARAPTCSSPRRPHPSAYDPPPGTTTVVALARWPDVWRYVGPYRAGWRDLLGRALRARRWPCCCTILRITAAGALRGPRQQ